MLRLNLPATLEGTNRVRFGGEGKDARDLYSDVRVQVCVVFNGILDNSAKRLETFRV